jgi:hypothetical protein
MIAICFLTVDVKKQIVRFAQTLCNEHYKIFICMDNIHCNIPEHSNITMIQIENSISEQYGFKGSVDYCRHRACSRDKALYYFSVVDTSFDHVWFLEEDVCVPTNKTILTIDKKYEGDLLCHEKCTKISHDDNTYHWCHWDKLIGTPFPWGHSMISAVRVSKRLLSHILDYATEHKKLLFDEGLFNTLALHHNLEITNPIELSTIHYLQHDVPVENSTYLYHPVRCLTKQENVRKSFNSIVISRWKKNVDFIYSIPNVNVFVYDKENPDNPYNIPVNKGNEASVYLKYIIDHYDSLPEYTFFMHDEEFAWHHNGSILNLYEEAIRSGQSYFNVNELCKNKMKDLLDIHHNSGGKEYMKWYKEFIQPYYPIENVELYHPFNSAAQFLVHKKNIQSLPLHFYQKLYDWITTTPLTNALSGLFMEWTWHLLWDTYPMKKKSIYKIIVSRYNESIHWLTPVLSDCVIYNKGHSLHLNEPLLPNIGRESHTYLEFIIQNYYELPDICIFTQGNIMSHGRSLSYLLDMKHHVEKFGKSEPSICYESYSGRIEFDPEFKTSLPSSTQKCFRDWFIENVQPKYPNPIFIYINGVFAVHKDKILQHPMSYYKHLQTFLSHDINPNEGHYFERSWYYIFN